MARPPALVLRAALCVALAVACAAAAGAQNAAPPADPPADPPPARVVIELGDVEVKVRSLRVLLTIDPDRAAALADAVAGATVEAAPPPE